ncbi:MAG: hypothetical protein AXA67_07365 [Methylothermaceae bacteria B42]|nr:MAG: hypothetical protein AXA67_07365 [Methylothermaceae bacteria B42]HHJ40156.1 hypothetical protein [Methylothermaceae bacterium]
MVPLDSLAIVFVLEALIGFSLFSSVLLIIFSRRKNQERDAVGKLINRLRKVENDRVQELSDILNEIGHLAPDQLETLLEEIKQHEKALYQQIFRLFLDRDVKLLGKIQQRIKDLSQPYLDLLKDLPQPVPDLSGELQQAQDEIKRLQAESEQLAKQLEIAMETIDRVSSEYTNMFGGGKSKEALEASRSKILQTLKDNERRINKIQQLDDDEIIITMEEES